MASPAVPVMSLRVTELQVDPEIQPRVSLSMSTIDDYSTLYAEAEEGEPLPPLDVFQMAGHYYVTDGFHRLEAAKLVKRKTLLCCVYEGTRQEAMRHAARANLRRGLPYTPRDRELILERFLSDPEMQELPDRALAAELGMSHMTVNRARHRRAALSTLHAEWEALQPAATSDTARIASLLELDPTTVSHARISQDERRAIVPRLARMMSDQGMSAPDAKAALRRSMERSAEQHVWERERRKQARQQQAQQEQEQQQRWEETWARQHQQAAEWQRTAPARELIESLTQLVQMCREERYPMAECIACLTPSERRDVATLLKEAETGLAHLTQALNAPRPKASRTQTTTS